MSKLKPCPFCGRSVYFVRGLDGDAVGIYCHQCKALTKFKIVMGKNETFGENAEKWQKAWNRRTSNEFI